MVAKDWNALGLAVEQATRVHWPKSDGGEASGPEFAACPRGCVERNDAVGLRGVIEEFLGERSRSVARLDGHHDEIRRAPKLNLRGHRSRWGWRWRR